MVRKRSINIVGHRTSVSIEQPFWAALKEIAQAEDKSITSVIHDIDQSRPPATSLSAAIRLYVLKCLLRDPSKVELEEK